MRGAPVVLGLVLIVGGLAGCKAKPGAYPEEAAAVGKPAALEANAAASKANTPGAPSAPATPMLAYRYGYELRMPGDAVRSLMLGHEQACVRAGPTVCQVVSSNADAGEAGISAVLKLRATPTWLSGFRNGVERDAKAAGGKVVSSNIESEDLTRSIVDTDAALKAKSTLRDRMQRLLAERPGKLSELLELEKAVAEVQGEIDAAQSELAVMRARVAMSELTVTYRSSAALGGGGLTLKQALAGFAGNVAGGAAVLVTLISYLLPFLLAGLLAVVAWRWRVRGRRKPPSA